MANFLNISKDSVNDFKLGENSVIGELMNNNQWKLSCIANSYIHDWVFTKDILQDVAIKFIEMDAVQREKVCRSVNYFERTIVRSVKNRAIEIYRRKNHNRDLPIEPELFHLSDLNDIYQKFETKEELETAIEFALVGLDKAIIHLILDGYKNEEIRKITELDENGLRVTKQRIKRKLKRILLQLQVRR